MQEIVGTGVALITPFKKDLSVDYNALSELVEYNISNGVEYLVISGTTGESVTVSADEKKAIIETVKNTNKGRLPLVLGIGGNNTAKVVEEIKKSDLDGISAILSVSPYYSKPTQEGLYAHFKAVAESTELPIILYNVPGRTSKNMLPETTLKLAKDFKNIVAVKEAGNDVHQYLNLLKNKPDDFHVISGDDDLALGVVLAGGSGVISVIGQAFPRKFSDMIRLGLKGDAKESYKLHFHLMEITALIFSENNPAGIKAVLEAMGKCDATVRLPLVEGSTDLKRKIANCIREMNNA